MSDTATLLREPPSAPAPPPVQPRPVPPPRAPDRGRGVLAGILALAAALRIPGLARFPFEQDELYTVAESRLLWDVPLAPGIDARPLYFLLQNGLFRVLPETPVALRAAPLLFGLLGVYVVWRAGARLLGGYAGAAAAFLVALAPWHLHASGMARYWSLLFLLAALFYLALARGCETDRRGPLLAALGALAAGMLTHPTFLFPAAGAALGASLVTRDGRWGWRWPSPRAWVLLWGPLLALAGGFALWLRLTGRGGAVQNWDGRGWAASLRLVPAMVEWLTPAVVVAALAGAVLLCADPSPARRRWGAMTLGGGITAVVLLLAASTRTDVYADYAIAALPLGFVSAGALVQLAAERMGRGARAFAVATAAVLGAAVLPATASHLSDGTRFDHRPAYRHVERTAPGTMVLTWPVVVQRHYAPSLRARGLAMDPRRLDALLGEEGDLWIVASVRRYGIVGDGDGSVRRWIARNCRWEMAHEGTRWDYRLYRVDLHRCTAPPG